MGDCEFLRRAQQGIKLEVAERGGCMIQAGVLKSAVRKYCSYASLCSRNVMVMVLTSQETSSAMRPLSRGLYPQSRT